MSDIYMYMYMIVYVRVLAVPLTSRGAFGCCFDFSCALTKTLHA